MKSFLNFESRSSAAVAAMNYQSSKVLLESLTGFMLLPNSKIDANQLIGCLSFATLTKVNQQAL